MYSKLMFLHLGTYSTPSPVSTKHIGPILETALQRAPILYIQTGNIQAAVNRYRYALIMYSITLVFI